MRPTTIPLLALGALCAAGCDMGVVTGLNLCMDSCGGGGPYAPWTTASIIGFPIERVDTTSARPQGIYAIGRLAVGDSVTLYAVSHLVTEDPCAATDTLRQVAWSSLDSTVLRTRGGANGRVTVHAVKPGHSDVLGEGSELHVYGLYACRASTGVSLSYVRVDSAAAAP